MLKYILGMTLSVLLMGCMGSGAMKTDLSKSLLVTEEGLVEKKSVTPLVQQLLLDPEVVRLLFAKNEKELQLNLLTELTFIYINYLSFLFLK